MNGKMIREQLLEVINEYEGKGPGFFQQGPILSKTAKTLGIEGKIELEQALLTIWHDLFRSGHVAWGYNLSNPGMPFCHLTENGRNILKNLSRDPANIDGYLNYLDSNYKVSKVVNSYIREAIKTYNGNCHKATAVMVGAAAERIILDIRDMFIDRMKLLKRTPNKGLIDWRIKIVFDAITQEIELKKKDLPNDVLEEFSSFWSAFANQIRIVRNEAGHPINIEKITEERVYASLLIFPELLGLGNKLMEWIKKSYQ